MIVRVLAAALVLAGLVWWERGLAAAAREERIERTGDIGRLLDRGELQRMQIAAVRLEWGDGTDVLHAQVGGMWRCLSAFNAPSDVDALQRLIGKITGAEGRVQSDDPRRAARYGIGTRETVRLSLCGVNLMSDPSRDVLWSVDIGKALPDGEGCFVRPRSSREIWAIDSNPHAELMTRPAPHLPPLLDGSVLSKVWVSAARGFERVFVERKGAAELELRRRDKPITDEQRMQGALPYEFVLDPDSDPLLADTGLAIGYLVFLQKVTLTDVLDPRTANELGPDNWDARVTIAPPPAAPDQQALQPLVLTFLKPIPGRGVPVINSFTNSIVEVERATIDLFLPTRESLLDAAGGNPYETWMQR